MFENFDKMFTWDKFTDYDYLNLTCIHPLKQNDVGIIIENLKIDKNIKFIAIFGSAVRFDCSQHSDLDIYVERFDENKKISRDFYDNPDFKSDVDLIYDLKHENRLFNEIESTGIIVYISPFDTTLCNSIVSKEQAICEFNNLRKQSGNLPKIDIVDINNEISASRMERK